MITRPSARWKRACSLAIWAAFLTIASARPAVAPPQPAFAQLIQQLSEPSGDFDTDNLISNEKSYLRVIPQLEATGLNGGVYIGVGPDQNFSYIAKLRPKLAFIVDIRRDNLLLHLLFKALFSMSRSRMEYLCLLTGRAPPSLDDNSLEKWKTASIQEIASYIDTAGRSSRSDTGKRVRYVISGFGVPLSDKDLQTIDRFHATFVDSGLALRFQSFGRPPREYYPTYRELLLETDGNGRQVSFMASEDDFLFVRAMETRDAVIPVVGNLGGDHAVAAIGKWMADHNERLSAFYVSNVENYLFRDGLFQPYMANMKQLPHSSRAVVIRSIFGGFSLPESVPGYYSTSVVQNFQDLLTNYAAGKYRSYSDLLRR
jgi:hypothetical protein